MNLHEWALIIFTILAQMCVGAFWVLGVAHFFAQRQAGAAEADRLSDRALLALGPLLAVAMVASFGHLGNPINAPRAILNFDSSWLSREILSFMTFMGLGAAFAFLQWRKLGSAALRTGVAWAAALVGLFLVFSMSQVYMLENQPAWNTFATPVQFFTTTFLLGALGMGSAFTANYAYVRAHNPECQDVQCQLLRSIVRGIAVAAVALLGVELIATPLQLAYLAANPAQAAVNSVALMYNQYGMMFGLRLVLAFVGAGIVSLFLYRYASAPGQELRLGSLVYSAFGLVLVSEVVGRFVFYAVHLKIGL